MDTRMPQRVAWALLLIGALSFSACNNPSKTNEIDVDLIHNSYSADGNNESQMPTIVFDCDLHDFGRLSEGESISYSFHFKNTGKSDLVISGCNASCGCTVADYPKKRIAPGEDGYVTVSFNSRGKIGQQYQEVTVNSNAQPSRNVLKITAQVYN